MSRRWMVAIGSVAGTVVAVLVTRGSLPAPGDLGHALAAAEWWWLGVAAVLQVGSVVMYAVQQRHLLLAFGGAMSHGRAVGLTLARTALSVAMPAGGAVSTAFAVRQFRRHGVTGPAALALTLLVSVQATAAMLLLYAGWCATAGLAALDPADLSPAVAAVVLLGTGTVAFHRFAPRARPGEQKSRPGEQKSTTYGAGRPRWRWQRIALDAARAATSLSRRDWLKAGGAALARRVLDLACLLALARAYDLDTELLPIIGAYLAVQVVRQIPLVAGGAGLVEAGLLAALVAGGAAEVAAAAVVLAYRLLSCWLVVLAGVPVLIGLGTGRPHPVLTPQPLPAPVT